MQGEKKRRELASDEIDRARSNIIAKHKACGGRGIVEKQTRVDGSLFPKKVAKICSCKKKFDLVSRMILSGVLYKKLRNQKIYSKSVFDEIEEEEVDLRDSIIYPFIKGMKKVVRNPYGLVFLGKNGTGKTFLGQKILFYAISYGYTAHYIELSSFLKLVIRNFNEDLSGVIYEISNVDILMVDEIGNESKRSDFVISEFKTLLKRRVQDRKPTILISNFSYKEFVKEYGKSVESVVGAYSKVFNFKKVPDVRKLRGAVELNSFIKDLKR